jgi:hypothetical protein
VRRNEGLKYHIDKYYSEREGDVNDYNETNNHYNRQYFNNLENTLAAKSKAKTPTYANGYVILNTVNINTRLKKYEERNFKSKFMRTNNKLDNYDWNKYINIPF